MAEVTALVKASVNLRGQAPAAWEDFLQAMRVFQAGTIQELIRCPPETLVKAQGRAQLIGELIQTMQDAPKLKDKITNG